MHDFQGYFSWTFQDQSDFPGLSRSWNFQGKKSRTFQEAWEPCIQYAYDIFLCTVHMLIAKIVPVKYVTIGPRDPPFVTLLVKTPLNKRRCLRKNGRIDEANVLAEKNQSSYLGNS